MLAHWFDSDMIAGLVGARFATARRETMRAGSRTIEVVRIRITAAGRGTLYPWKVDQAPLAPIRPFSWRSLRMADAASCALAASPMNRAPPARV